MSQPQDTSAPGAPQVSALTLAQWLQDGHEIALLDIREAGLFGESHALLAVNLPLSRLELDIGTRVPRPDTRTVLIAEDDAQGQRAAAALAAIGYTALWTLAGGAPGWVAAGLPVFQGVNVPSKALAEYVEHHYHTPDITPQDLAALQASPTPPIVLDSRTVEEHRRFHVPGAIACPGSELVPRFADLVPSPETLVVVSCAGRTRGVMGAQTLISAGVPNRVLALRGGTQGWRLAGLPIQTGRGAEAEGPSTESRAQARERANTLAIRHGIARIDASTLARWQTDTTRTTYLFDVRTEAEYLAGHVPGATWAIGVQLIQCLDQWAAVRGARVVLADDDGTRALLTAYWLRQLGWDASAFTPAADTALAPGLPQPALPALPPLPSLSAEQAHAALQQGALLLDASPSAVFRQGHAPHARWVNRARLAAVLPEVRRAKRVVAIAEDEGQARLIALDLRHDAEVAWIEGGLAAWRSAGLPLEASSCDPPDGQRVDHLFWLHDRHDGNAQASAAYLEWEAALPASIGDPANAGLSLADAYA